MYLCEGNPLLLQNRTFADQDKRIVAHLVPSQGPGRGFYDRMCPQGPVIPSEMMTVGNS
jgi:hypothetical protein